jgi:multidrug efflux pump subunit AcrA (membrane-fusion protein)
LLNQNGFAVSSTQLESAGASITEAKNNLTDKINDAFVKADDAIHNTADQFYSNAGSSSSVLNVYISDSDLRSKLGVGRYEMELLLDKWQTEINKTNPTLEDVKTNEARLVTVKNYLTDLAAAVNSLVAGNTTEQTTFDAYKASVSTARTNISTAIANLTAAREKYVSATSNLQIEEGDTKGQLAKVDQSRAKVLSVQAQLNKRVIVAPFDGLVTKQDAKVGQIATAGTVLSGVISKGNLEVEAYVPEVHIGKLMVGNTVEITFDAFPGEKFSGQIIMIDPAETIVGGVPNYEIKVVINQTDSRLRSGLTANLLVQTAKKENVVMVPRFALDEKDGKTFVTKLENGQAVLTPIEIGLIGTDGMVEIVSGLTAGDKVTVSK